MSVSSEPAVFARSSYRVLVVDDDPDILRVVRVTMTRAGYEVATATSAAAALAEIGANGLPHLAIVDVMMPEVDGFDFCRAVQKFSDLPVLMLSAVNEEATIVRGIREVAEDYVTKPFGPQELLARVERVLRRIGDFTYSMPPVVRIDEQLSVDFGRQQAALDGTVVSLSPTETKIFHILFRSAPRAVTTDFLLRRLWPLEEVYEEALRVHVHRLRRKIEDQPSDPKRLLTEWGIGYVLKVQPDPSD